MNKAASAYVLDTSAWLTLIEDEAGADAVQDILELSQPERWVFWLLN